VRHYFASVDHAVLAARLRRRIADGCLPALERRVAAREMEADSARASLASWFGLARPADAFRLSQHIFLQRDVDNTGKRLLVRWLQR